MSASNRQQLPDLHTARNSHPFTPLHPIDNAPARLLRRLLSTNCHWLLFLTVFLLSVAADAPCSWKQTRTGESMESPFERWIGRAVIVQLTLGQVKLSLRGTLLKDGSEILLVKPEAGSDLEIPKTKVLAIEEVRRCCTACHAFSPSTMPRVRYPARFTNRQPS